MSPLKSHLMPSVRRRTRSSTIKTRHANILACALFLCCLGGLVSALLESKADQGQPAALEAPASNQQQQQQKGDSKAKSFFSWLMGRGNKESPAADAAPLILVEPFDSVRELGPAEPGSQEVNGLGLIKLIGGKDADDSTANFFPCSFGIYSRLKGTVEIKAKASICSSSSSSTLSSFHCHSQATY